MLCPEQSNPQNNPNHPTIRCVDGQDECGNWCSIDDRHTQVRGPFRVFDILNQQHVGPLFSDVGSAIVHMQHLGGACAPSQAYGTVHAELGTALHTIFELRQALAALLKAAENLRDTPEHSGDELSDEAAHAIAAAEPAIDTARAIIAQGDY